jgi:acyl-CoA synthetase (AMP-forming)/AMP-acid ligase II
MILLDTTQEDSDSGLLTLSEGDSPCARDDQHNWISRATINRATHNLAQRLSENRPGFIFLFGSNDVPTVVGLLAAFAARMPVALLDPKLPFQSIERLIAIYRPEIMLGGDFVCGNLGYQAVSQDDLILAPTISCSRAACATSIHQDLALLLSTSGSTGSPKFVRLSQMAVLANARQIAEALAINAADIGICHLPIHYSYGLSVITSHLIAGAAISLMTARVTEPAFWNRIRDDSSTHLPGVPFHYGVIDRLGIKRTVPESVRTFTQAGGHMAHQLRLQCHNAISERGGRFYIMYGQTEAGPRITTLQSDDFLNHSTTVGRALRGGKLTVVDDEGAPLAADVEGNIIYEGPNVMMGYASCRDDLALPDIQCGRLATGDRGVLNGDGFLTLTGRTQRFAKVAGLRVALDEIEDYLGSSGSIAAIAPDDKILLYVHNSAASAVAELVPKLAQRIQLPSTHFVTRVVETLPLKPSGKIDYKALEQLK